MVKRGAKLLLGALVLGVVAYGAVALSLHFAAKRLVDQTIALLKQNVPMVQDIQYGALKFSPYNFLHEQLTLENMTLSFKNTSTVMHIDALTVHHFRALEHAPLGSFDLKTQGLSVNTLEDFYPGFGTLPSELHLNLDAVAHFDAPKQTLQATLDLNTANISLLHYSVDIGNLTLPAPSEINNTDWNQVLGNAQINAFAYSAAINAPLSTTALVPTFPLLANLLENLGYTTLPLRFSLSSTYAKGQNTEALDANLNIAQLGQLQTHWILILGHPPSPADLLHFFFQQDLSIPSNMSPTLIASGNLIYKDESFALRFLQFLANNMHEPVPRVQAMLQATVTQFMDRLNVPGLGSINIGLTRFIATPGTLTLNLSPPAPFSLDDIARFFASQKMMNNSLKANFPKLSDAQKQDFFARYEQASRAGYANFLTRIGVSMSASS